jgi:hypothetical protein
VLRRGRDFARAAGTAGGTDPRDCCPRLTFPLREGLRSDVASRRRRCPCNREKEEIVKNTDTVKAQGLGAVLDGCANCCEGVLQQVRDANAS